MLIMNEKHAKAQLFSLLSKEIAFLLFAFFSGFAWSVLLKNFKISIVLLIAIWFDSTLLINQSTEPVIFLA